MYRKCSNKQCDNEWTCTGICIVNSKKREDERCCFCISHLAFYEPKSMMKEKIDLEERVKDFRNDSAFKGLSIEEILMNCYGIEATRKLYVLLVSISL